MMAIYWVQSVIIGISHTVRIALLRRFSKGKLNLPETGPMLKFVVAGIFLFHYVILHLFLGIYIDARAGYYRLETLPAAGAWWLCAAVFLLNHAYSLWHNIRLDRLGEPSLQTLMFLPYWRVIPFQATGFVFELGRFALDTAGWVAFAITKTVADVAMHVVEHRVLRRAGPG